MIIKNNLPQEFTIVPRLALRDPSLSWQAKGLLAWLCSHTQEFKIKQKTLKAFARNGEDASIAAMRELIDAGYLKFHGRSRAIGGKLGDSIYSIEPKPVAPPERSPDRDFPESGKTRSGKTRSGFSKASLSNTNVRNTNTSNSKREAPSENLEFEFPNEYRVNEIGHAQAYLLQELSQDPADPKIAALIPWLQYLYLEIDKPLGYYSMRELLKEVKAWPLESIRAAVSYSISRRYAGLQREGGASKNPGGGEAARKSEDEQIKEYYNDR